ncbi:efflux RND transporter periplasmic adaptor subunit [Rubripirellula reticaptiva]|uniref:Macrolide export protein MacA n=1 Tax=Rubripirellula reticaptiva TaxID=2528013 RepID=A0A5C6EPW0_9BACT|nr:efflux RND transporter periplasmic adaptor subunit [Rubripirellula reticaptiva]TWU51803.1 Macrolide export protein MacA [Rubripirellula reticaptiva]
MKFSIQTLLLGVLVVALGIVGYLSLSPSAVDVEFATATIGPLRVAVFEDGKTRVREKYTVSAPVSGRISRIELNAGDYCNEKTLLAVILPSAPAILDARSRAEANARVQAAQSAVERAKSSGEQAKISHDLSEAKFDRVEKLLASQAVSRDEYDIAKAELLASEQAIQTTRFDQEIATFELDMAKAAVSQFNGDNDEPSANPFEIYAPISGRVLRVIQESSAVVTVGTPLIELGDPSNLEIEIDVLSTDAVRIKPGSEMTVEHWGGGSPLKGYVRVVEPAAFTKISSLGVEEQRVNVIADFNELPERIASLGDGYRVEASITVNELDEALLIPNSALFRHQRAWHVLSIVDNQATLQPVTIGLQNDSQTQITKGLDEGDCVIVYPSDTLKPGTAVRAVATAANIAVSAQSSR